MNERILTEGGAPLLTPAALRLAERFAKRSGLGDEARFFFHDKVQWLDCRVPDGEPELFMRLLEERGYVRAPGGLVLINAPTMLGATGTSRIAAVNLDVGEYDAAEMRVRATTRLVPYLRVAYRGFVVLYDSARKRTEFGT